MKKIILVCLAMLPVAIIFAQKPYYGIKAGVNSSNILIANGNNTDHKIGFNAGLLAHIHASKNWAFQPEINYSEQGGKQVYVPFTYVTTLKYIQVPILVQYMFGPGYRLQAGPQVSFLTGANGVKGDLKENIKNNFQSTDVSISVGGGILTKSQIGIDFRWNFGVSDINKNATTAGSHRNNVGQLSLFYMFNHKGK